MPATADKNMLSLVVCCNPIETPSFFVMNLQAMPVILWHKVRHTTDLYLRQREARSGEYLKNNTLYTHFNLATKLLHCSALLIILQ